MVGDDVGTRDEREAEQAMRGVERRRQHSLQRKVGLEHRIVQVVPRLAHLFGVVAPVPGLDRVGRSLRFGQCLQRIALRRRAGLGRFPYLREEAGHRVGRAGHPVDERIVRVIVVAVEPRLLVAQGQDLAGDRPVVARPVVLAARRPRLERLLAQVAPVRVREERHDEGTGQRDDPGRVDAAFLGRFARGRPNVVGQSGEVALVDERQAVVRFVGQHVLHEAGGELRRAAP